MKGQRKQLSQRCYHRNGSNGMEQNWYISQPLATKQKNSRHGQCNLPNRQKPACMLILPTIVTPFGTSVSAVVSERTERTSYYWSDNCHISADRCRPWLGYCGRSHDMREQTNCCETENLLSGLINAVSRSTSTNNIFNVIMSHTQEDATIGRFWSLESIGYQGQHSWKTQRWLHDNVSAEMHHIWRQQVQKCSTLEDWPQTTDVQLRDCQKTNRGYET